MNLRLLGVWLIIHCTWAQAADVLVLREAQLPNRNSGRVHSVQATGDGGSVLCGEDVNAWVVVLSPDAKVTTNSSVGGAPGTGRENCWAILEHSENGTLVAGQTNAHALIRGWDGDTDYRGGTPYGGLVALVGQDGHAVWRKAYGPFEPYYQNGFFRGIRVKDGFVVLGTKTRTEATERGNIGRPARSLWILKIDSQGDVLWEYELSHEGEVPLDAGYEETAGNLTSLEDGTIVVAASLVRLASSERAGERVVDADGKLDPKNKGGLYLLKLAADGHRVALKRIERRGVRSIMATQTAILLAGNAVKETASGLQRPVQLTVIDHDLNIQQERNVDLPGAIFMVQGACLMDDGGLLVIGIHRRTAVRGALAEAALAMLTSSFNFHLLQRYGVGVEFGAIAHGAHDDEYVVVRRAVVDAFKPTARSEATITTYKIRQ